MELFNIPRCACRGPRGTVIPARRGRTDRWTGTKTKGDED